MIKDLKILQINIKNEKEKNIKNRFSINRSIFKLFIKYYFLTFLEIIYKYYRTFKRKNILSRIIIKLKLFKWKILKILNLNELAFDYRYKKIDENLFKKLLLIDNNELNMKIRKKHFQLITNNLQIE